MHGDETIEFPTRAILLLACLPAVTVNVKEYIDLSNNTKTSEICLKYFAAFALYIAPFGYDIVVYTAAYIQPVVSALIQQQQNIIRAQQFSHIQ